MRSALRVLQGLVTIVAVLATHQAFAQEDYIIIGDAYSELNIDKVTGEIHSYAYSEVAGWWDSELFSVDTTLSTGPSDGDANNCGEGCAQIDVYDQVPYLGQTYSESSYHWGEVFDNEGLTGCEPCQGSTATYVPVDVPPAPNIQVASIDPSDPRNVAWSFSVDGASLVSPYITIGGGDPIYENGDSTNPVVFTTDQELYPGGVFQVQLFGTLYGLTLSGGGCNVLNAYQTPAPMTSDGYLVTIPGDAAGAFQTISAGQNTYAAKNGEVVDAYFCTGQSGWRRLDNVEDVLSLSLNDPTISAVLDWDDEYQYFEVGIQHWGMTYDIIMSNNDQTRYYTTAMPAANWTLPPNGSTGNTCNTAFLVRDIPNGQIININHFSLGCLTFNLP